MAYGLTPDGFVAKTLEEIEAAMAEQERANIDAALDTSQYGLVGQLNGIMASAIAELWELGEALYDAMDPDKATGQAQDALYSLTTTPREDASHSHVLCDVGLGPSTSIAARTAIASVAGNPTARFTNTAPIVNLTAAPAVIAGVPFEALEAGPVRANAGTLTQRDTLISGWQTVTNPTDAELGSGVESNVEYRQRRQDELAAPGGGTVDGIRADLLGLETVISVTVIENITEATSPDGVPPKSFEAVVRSQVGALDEDAIAEVIWKDKPAGIRPWGTVTRDVLDSEGVAHTIGFSRPTELTFWLAMRLTTGPGYLGDVALRVVLAASADNPDSAGYLEVNTEIYAGRFVQVAMQQPGVLNAEAHVSLTSSDYALGVPAITTAQRQIGQLDTSHISIVPIPGSP